MSEPIIKIRNHHTPQCGDPPIIDSEAENLYVGYYENSHGEQWLYTFDRNTGIAVLRGGDVGWNNSFEVSDGHVKDLILGIDEQLWLQACWQAH